ncbi:phosphatase 2C-like domain-containing protein [Mycena rebaudengoi]|nr:phosphatase 2C-like domain-containing protein [Mycena rebaudengoi]
MNDARIVSLPAASSSEILLALQEVSQFTTTDMGYTFRVLSEPSLTTELKRLSHPRSNGRVDSVTFQPCSPHVHQNQDRYVVQDWNFPGGTWQFSSIFDGHVNHHTVDYVAQTLPANIRDSLGAALSQSGGRSIAPDRVCHILRESVVRLDDLISSSFLELFPRDPRHLSRMTDKEIQSIFYNDNTGRGSHCSCTILTDPQEKNVWVANLGVLGLHHHNGGWAGSLINQIHSGQNPREVGRIRTEHAREPHSVTNSRVLGFLEPTRAIGDTWLKIPSLYTSRVFANLNQDWISQASLQQFSARIFTPPYVSNIPDVYHHSLPNRPWFLILCSDGLPATEIYENMDLSAMVRAWTHLVGQLLDSQTPPTNLALSLLRAAIGGADERKVSRILTAEMEERWMDDVSISIQRFNR